MRTTFLIALMIGVGCSFYVIQEFKLPEKSKFIVENDWKIIPHVTEQQSSEDFKNRYSCSITFSIYSNLIGEEYRKSEYNVQLENMRIVLPDTTYSYTPSDCYKLTANDDKKSYTYELRRTTEEDIQKLPFIDKENTIITVECDVLFSSKKDSTTQKRTYSYYLVRREIKGVSSFFLN